MFGLVEMCTLEGGQHLWRVPFERKRVLFRVPSLPGSFCLVAPLFVYLFLRQCLATQSEPARAIFYFSVLRAGTPVPFPSVLTV